MENTIELKTPLLKESRLQFLRLHKMLIDSEREKFERLNGQISSGQFLNLLLTDPGFEWLRKFSMLIVEIDEMLDLDDGFTEDMVEKHLSQMRVLLRLESPDEEFNEKYKKSLESNTEVLEKHYALKTLLGEK